MTQTKVHCDCNAVEVTMEGEPVIHAYCHCEDCRELLQVPYHSVLAWDPEQVQITRGQDSVVEFQHPSKNMKRIFCGKCGDILYNTNARGRKLVSQLLLRKCNDDKLPEAFQSSAHFFYDRRVIDIDDELRKS
ncbi:GFA family protein [Biformimicrobium ophioploci]|uniref:CENP-V/GFA domain-containing protein n=1 Tax=Biformimicrobium ophioploci TaxID=3036711 RepID=A0ABQ6LXW5_9GAMM|nr:GFA family protein [Microbulbifer sp. NKW57]GMG86949.1 hypothetical protein MNKW57_12700 [Microbulbifer sp. NKW57]